MATPNIVPRADSEGGLGTASKYWASAYIDAITTTGNVVIGGTLTVSAADSISIADYILHSGDNSKFGFPSDDNFKIRLAGSDVFTISSTIATFAGTVEANAPELTDRTTTTASKALSLVREVNDSSHADTKDSAVDFMLSRQQAVANNLPYTRLDIRLSGEGADSSTPSVDVMSLLYDGKVGIGTTAPVPKLHVYQNDSEVDTATGLTIEQDGDGDAALSFLLSGTKRWKMGIDNSDSDKFKISDSTNLASDARLTIDGSGNATFAETITWGGSKGVLTYGSDRATLRSSSILEIQTNGASSPTAAITLDNSQNATFAGEVNVLGEQLLLTSANSEKPLLHLKSTANGTAGPHIKFEVDRGAEPGAGDDLGTILWAGEDSNQNPHFYAKILGEILNANSTDEAGRLTFFVGESDGTTADLSPGLKLEGSSSVDGEVNVTIGNTATSTVTIPGTINGIPFYSDVAGNSMYTHDVSATDSDADFNTAYGFAAMDAITTGTSNTAIGYSSMSTASKAANNVAIGRQALEGNSLADRNVAVGMGALQNMVGNGGDNHATYNTALGYSAGKVVTTGVQNTLIGGLVGDALTEGDSNTAVGYAALTSETQGDRNVAIGNSTLSTQNNTSHVDAYNIAIGYAAGQSVTTGTLNTLIGGLAGDGISLGSHNIALGYNALGASNAGSKSVAIGSGALQAQQPQFTQGSSSTTAGSPTVTFPANSAVITGLKVDVTTGTDQIPDNTFVGAVSAGSPNSTFAMVDAAGSAVNATGSGTATGLTLTFSGGVEGNNTAVGYNAGNDVTTSVANTLIGSLAGGSVTVGSSNTAFGFNAGGGTTTGGNNTFVGSGAGVANVGGASNICIGRDANLGGASFGNSITIGTSITNNLGSNSVEIGNTSMTKFKTHGAMTNRAYTGIAEGTGIDATDAVSISVGEYNSEIITNIFVDIGAGSIQSSSTDNGAIGNATDADAYITRVTTAVNGVVYKAELICVETPTVASGSLQADLDLRANASGTIASGSAVSGSPICNSAGDHALGRFVRSADSTTNTITPDHYLYLAQSGTNAGVYNAGKFLIRLYGAKVTGL